MSTSRIRALFLIAGIASLSNAVPGEFNSHQMKEVVGQVVEEHVSGCHLLLWTTMPHSHLVSVILRRMTKGVVMLSGTLGQPHLPQGLLGDTRTTCRALIIHLDDNNSNSTDMFLRLLDRSELRKFSETRVVVLGGRAGVKSVLLHTCFRNTVHALYLALHSSEPEVSPLGILRKSQGVEKPEHVSVYRRCLYCNSGNPDFEFIAQLNHNDHYHSRSLYNHIQFRDMYGHKVRMVAMSFFPYMDFENSGQPGSIVTPLDTLDVRIAYSLSSALNFTFDIHENFELEWGTRTNGKFDGMMGELQREESDFCSISAPTPERLETLNYARGYPADLLVIVSLKPTLLPAYLAIVRPFKGEVWVSLFGGVVLWGITLWILQRVWMLVEGKRNLQFSKAILFGWGALLENPAADPSINVSGQMLVGWWLVFCLLVDTGYRSSLVAHLTVQARSPTLETFQDLLDQGSWTWGTEKFVLSGASLEYFVKHISPVVLQIYKEVEIQPTLKDGLDKVLTGGYSFITYKNKVAIAVVSSYTDTFGYSPLHISRDGDTMFSAFGWNMRRGAPFHPVFYQLMSRLEDAGITAYWMDDVIAKRGRQNRAEAAKGEDGVQVTQYAPQQDSKVVLGLNHLQGVFYVLFLGSVVALLTLVAENFTH